MNRLARRRIVVVAASAFLFPPFRVLAQQPAAKVWRIGFLAAGPRPSDDAPPSALRRALAELGHVDGQAVVYVGRWGEAKPERLPALAAELAQKTDLVVAFGWKSARAMKQATSTVPIVFVGSGDPVATGLTAAFSRPGGNITGVSDQSDVLSAKRLELLKEVVPKASRVAVLWNADDLSMTLRYHELEKAAGTLGVTLQPLGVREPEDFQAAFTAMNASRPDALVLVTDLLTNLNRRRIMEFAAEHRIPAMYEYGYLVREGGLMSYGPDYDDMFRRAALYVDKIIGGAKPAELPVDQPTRYYLLVNLGTARMLDLTFPSSLLVRADEAVP